MEKRNTEYEYIFSEVLHSHTHTYAYICIVLFLKNEMSVRTSFNKTAVRLWSVSLHLPLSCLLLIICLSIVLNLSLIFFSRHFPCTIIIIILIHFDYQIINDDDDVSSIDTTNNIQSINQWLSIKWLPNWIGDRKRPEIAVIVRDKKIDRDDKIVPERASRDKPAETTYNSTYIYLLTFFSVSVALFLFLLSLSLSLSIYLSIYLSI